ncbi:hypothetical protein PpBr36_05333 [Pyricularia pennisetigena]|uniref:hypothetical protein n=1 Tax=Pyricularia pennisetigena TaxID=1578925 RepID=UPI00114E9F4E|nr:hypothetical protein PpBr36_05333 [Pyricularia pennisetigena]TLS27263.1 hypothetical protein PpBr36_05333 [Pyricularia pennisetigena]
MYHPNWQLWYQPQPLPPLPPLLAQPRPPLQPLIPVFPPPQPPQPLLMPSAPPLPQRLPLPPRQPPLSAPPTPQSVMGDYIVTKVTPMPVHLLGGCNREAQRAYLLADMLEDLRQAVSESLHTHMAAVGIELRQTCRLLRELTERAHVHERRVPVVLDYIQVLLPCLMRTLTDMWKYLEDRTMPRETRWRKMYNDLTKEGDMPLHQRFLTYNNFLHLLTQMVACSPLFDLHALDRFQEKILSLRVKMGINKPPARIGPPPEQALVQISARGQTTNHWATQVYKRSLASRTPLEGIRRESVVHTRPAHASDLSFPPGTELLFRRVFDNGNVSMSFYLIPTHIPAKPVKRAPYIVGCHYRDGFPKSSRQGVHELCIRKSGGRGLVLTGWDDRKNRPQPWAALAFNTWEEMVLFYCSFLSLKVSSPLMIGLQPDEWKLGGEYTSFQAIIIEDGVEHSLQVLEDANCGGLRLLTEASHGDQKYRPIWTAFVTHQCQSHSWLDIVSQNVVWLRELQLYVFSSRYREENMRQNKYGAFEIHFKQPVAASKFASCLRPPPPPPASVMHPEDIDERSESRAAPSVDSTRSESLPPLRGPP